MSFHIHWHSLLSNLARKTFNNYHFMIWGNQIVEEITHQSIGLTEWVGRGKMKRSSTALYRVYAMIFTLRQWVDFWQHQSQRIELKQMKPSKKKKHNTALRAVTQKENHLWTRKFTCHDDYLLCFILNQKLESLLLPWRCPSQLLVDTVPSLSSHLFLPHNLFRNIFQVEPSRHRFPF